MRLRGGFGKGRKTVSTDESSGRETQQSGIRADGYQRSAVAMGRLRTETAVDKGNLDKAVRRLCINYTFLGAVLLQMLSLLLRQLVQLRFLATLSCSSVTRVSLLDHAKSYIEPPLNFSIRIFLWPSCTSAVWHVDRRKASVSSFV